MAATTRHAEIHHSQVAATPTDIFEPSRSSFAAISIPCVKVDSATEKHGLSAAHAPREQMASMNALDNQRYLAPVVSCATKGCHLRSSGLQRVLCSGSDSKLSNRHT